MSFLKTTTKITKGTKGYKAILNALGEDCQFMITESGANIENP